MSAYAFHCSAFFLKCLNDLVTWVRTTIILTVIVNVFPTYLNGFTLDCFAFRDQL